MVFPIDREEEIHSRLISLIQDQIRKVIETVKSLSLLIESSVNIQSEKIIEEKYMNVIKNEEEAR